FQFRSNDVRIAIGTVCRWSEYGNWRSLLGSEHKLFRGGYDNLRVRSEWINFTGCADIPLAELLLQSWPKPPSTHSRDEDAKHRSIRAKESEGCSNDAAHVSGRMSADSHRFATMSICFRWRNRN